MESRVVVVRCTSMVLRIALVLASVGITATATADPDVCSTPPHSRTPRAMRVELDRGNLIATAPGSEFPAVSEDGSRFVELFEDTQDFTGFPIHTLVVWSRTGARVAEIVTASSELEGPASRRPDAQQNKGLREASAALAATKWRPLDRFRPCDNTEHVIELGDGFRVSIDEDAQTIVTSRPRVVTKLKPPGVNAELKPGAPCGRFNRLVAAFGGSSVGVVIVSPGPQLGGDMCQGGSSGAYTIAVPIR